MICESASDSRVQAVSAINCVRMIGIQVFQVGNEDIAVNLPAAVMFSLLWYFNSGGRCKGETLHPWNAGAVERRRENENMRE